jgi:hypothetical protein
MKKFVIAALLAAAPAFAQPALKAPITDLRKLPITVMQPYDEKADAMAVIDAAMAQAKASHKRLLVDLGGNWCADCIILMNFMQLPSVRGFVDAHYAVALVDVGRFNKNLQVPARFGFTGRLRGVPMILVVTPEGEVLNRNDVFATADARNMTPQALADYLAKYAD